MYPFAFLQQGAYTMTQKKHSTTLLTKEQALADRRWFLLDAKGKTLGRFAAEVAKVLRGKHKTSFTPHTDCGDGVVIINADQIQVTGSKEARKIYRYYTGGMGGLREVPYRVMKDRKPDYIIRNAVEGMMPKSRLAKEQLTRLRIYAHGEHDMDAQKPIPVGI
jgi:large subunit ribosomal protein L13